MVRKRLAIALMVALAAVGCAPSSYGSGTPEDRWSESGIGNYLIRATDDQQGPYGNCTWITEVHDAVVDTRWMAPGDQECGDWDVSVPALHSEIEERGAVVEWGKSGVPTHIILGPAETADDALSLTIEFEDLTGVHSIRTELAEARQRWAAAEIGSYRVEVVETRNYWSTGCRWITVTTDGVATEISLGPEPPGSTSGKLCTETEWNIPKLHSLISRFADNIDEFSHPDFGEHTLEVDFADDGVPRAIRFDLANGNDEESIQFITFIAADSSATTSGTGKESAAPEPMDDAGNIAVGETRTRRISTHCGMNVLYREVNGSQWFAVNRISSNSTSHLPPGWIDDGDEQIELELERVSENTILARPIGTKFTEEYRRATDQDSQVGCD